MTAPLAFVDVESTGLDPDVHEIWEVGLILRDSEGIEVERSWQLPVDLGRADPMALKIGRFHERRSGWAGSLCWPDTFAREFADLTVGAHLVGAVVSFDEERLRKLLRANSQCPMWHHHLIDVEALAVGWLAAAYDPETPVPPSMDKCRPPWKSDELSLAVGIDPANFDRHSALGDAQWARAIYDAIMGPEPE